MTATLIKYQNLQHRYITVSHKFNVAFGCYIYANVS